MARKKSSNEHIEPSLSAEQAIPLFQKQVEKIVDLIIKLRYDDPRVREWMTFTRELITRAFGTRSNNLSAFFSGQVHRDAFSPYGDSEETKQGRHVKTMDNLKVLLNGFIEQLRDFAPSPAIGARPAAARSGVSGEATRSRRVFIVHGHDDRAKAELARIIERLGLQPIILHEQANRGRTLIEKLEDHTEVGYCFVLLTADDEGRRRGTTAALLARARQNVVLELGLFMGLLGRTNVCCLLSGNVDLPTDLGGFAQLRFNESVNEKRLEIVDELRAAGFNVSADKLSAT